MQSLPLALTACIETETLQVLAVAIDGEIKVVFPRGTNYMKVKRFALKHGGEIRLQTIRATYEILPDNEPYDTSPKVLY
jgi:hypothetical protein